MLLAALAAAAAVCVMVGSLCEPYGRRAVRLKDGGMGKGMEEERKGSTVCSRGV